MTDTITEALERAMQAAEEHQIHFGKSIVHEHFKVADEQGGVYVDHLMKECPVLRSANIELVKAGIEWAISKVCCQCCADILEEALRDLELK